jgi:ribosomal protein S18 acetylase RimI-like enzyme
MIIGRAQSTDIPELTVLINNAYRGEASKKGWTSEADLLEGSLRIDSQGLTKMMEDAESIILKCSGEKGEALLGCVYLQRRKDFLYLGLLSVSPFYQARGIGKSLLIAATDHALHLRCSKIQMTVISVRLELIAWYQRHGFLKTGETAPFPHDAKFGRPRLPLEFLVLEKIL